MLVCRRSLRVEYLFLTLKRIWGFAKVRYRGLAKNANRAFAMLALINLRKWGSPPAGQARPLRRRNAADYRAIPIKTGLILMKISFDLPIQQNRALELLRTTTYSAIP